MKMNKWLVAMIAAILLSATVDAQARTETLARIGDPAPRGGTYISSFGSGFSFLSGNNGAGQTAFTSVISPENLFLEGLYLAGPDATVDRIASTGLPLPTGPGSYGGFASVTAINSSGEVAFGTDISGGFSRSAIVRAGAGTGTEIVRGDDPLPAGLIGTFDGHPTPAALGQGGHVVFDSNLDGTPGGSSDDFGLFRGDGVVIEPIVIQGQATPDGNGTFDRPFAYPNGVNSAGQVFFVDTDILGTSGGNQDNKAIFRWDPPTPALLGRQGNQALNGNAGTITQLVRAGDNAPGDGTYFSFGINPSFNDAGQFAVFANVTPDFGTTRQRLMLFDPDGTAREVARFGQDTPNMDGKFERFEETTIEPDGDVLFAARLFNTPNQSGVSTGLYHYDQETGEITEVVRGGQTYAPVNTTDPGGEEDPSINAITRFASGMGLGLSPAGPGSGFTVAVELVLTDTAGGNTDDRAVVLIEGPDAKQVEVLRKGKNLEGKTVTDVRLDTRSTPPNVASLSKRMGDFTFNWSTDDGSKGIARVVPDAVWTAASGAWSEATNWRSGFLPGLDQDVIINPQGGTVELDVALIEVNSMQLLSEGDVQAFVASMGSDDPLLLSAESLTLGPDTNLVVGGREVEFAVDKVFQEGYIRWTDDGEDIVGVTAGTEDHPVDYDMDEDGGIFIPISDGLSDEVFLRILGQMEVDGELEIVLPEEMEVFEPQHGDVFTLISATELTGEFDTYTGDVFDIGNNKALVPVIDHDAGTVTIITTAPGDANGDGVVDAGDLNELALNWQGDNHDWYDGDFTGDGLVNAADLNLLAINWQLGVDQPSLVSFDDAWSAALAAVIPEPGTATLAVLGLGWLSRRRN